MMSESKKYWAFISYSSRDKKWGSWLHSRLENYPIPKEFRDKEIFDGAVLGKNLRPVFRDRDELSGSAELGPAIEKALKASRYLIVLCSKNSAKSEWVNKEIEDFRAMGGEKYILALILNGEPNATSNASVDDSEECFPQALRYPLEPLAGDLRKEGDGKERGFLKVLSGIAQVDFDVLYRRHERAQQKKRIFISVIAATIILMLTGLSIFAFNQQRLALQQKEQAEFQRKEAEKQKSIAVEQRQKAEDNEREAVKQKKVADQNLEDARHNLAKTFLVNAQKDFESRDIMSSLRNVQKSLFGTSPDSEDVLKANSKERAQGEFLLKRLGKPLLEQRSKNPLSGFFLAFNFSEDESLLGAINTKKIVVWTWPAKAKILEVDTVGRVYTTLSFSEDKEKIFLTDSKGHFYVISLSDGQSLGSVKLKGNPINPVNIPIGNDRCLVKTDIDELSILSVKGEVEYSLKLDEPISSVSFSNGRGVLISKGFSYIISSKLAVVKKEKFESGSIIYKSVSEGNLLALMYADKSISLYDIKDSKIVERDSWDFPVKITDIDLVGGEVYVLSEFGNIAQLKSGLEKHKAILDFPVGNMRQVKVLENGHRVLGLGWDSDMFGSDSLFIGDLKSKKVSGSPLGELVIPDTTFAGPVHPYKSNIVFFLSFKGLMAKVLSTKKKFLICPSNLDNPVVDFTLSSDTNWLSVLLRDGTLNLYETRNQMKARKVKLESGVSFSSGKTAFSFDNESLYVTGVGSKGLIKLDIADLSQTSVLSKDQFGISQTSPIVIKFLQKDKLLFINMNEISIYNLADNKYESLQIKPSKLNAISRIEFDANYIYVLGSTGDGESGIAIFEFRTFEEVAFLSGHKGWANGLCVLGDGRLLVTGKDDVTIWDLTNVLSVKSQIQVSRVSPAFEDKLYAWTGDGYYTRRSYLRLSDGEPANVKKISHDKDFFAVSLIEGVRDRGVLYFEDIYNKIYRLNPKDPDSHQVIVKTKKGQNPRVDKAGTSIIKVIEGDILNRYSTNGVEQFSVQLDGKYIKPRTTNEGRYNLVSSPSKSNVCLFNSKGEKLHTFENFSSAEFSNDEKSVLLLGKNYKTIKAFDLSTLTEEWSISSDAEIKEFKDIGKGQLLTVNNKGEVCVWSTELQELLHKEYRPELRSALGYANPNDVFQVGPNGDYLLFNAWGISPFWFKFR